MRIVLLLILLTSTTFGATTNVISKFGITFYFDAPVTNGWFINGDPWVQAPVTITNITPVWTGSDNGAEINPKWGGLQGFCDEINFDPALRAAPPFTIPTNATIVATIGTGIATPMIKTALALTVLQTAPATNAFRPPYIGNDKPVYTLSDVQTNLLPTYSAAISSVPSIASLLALWTNSLMMDHMEGYARRGRPQDVLEDYEPANSKLMIEAALRIMLDDPWADRLPLAIQWWQYTLDRSYVCAAGYRATGTGHNPGHRMRAVYGATLFNISAHKTIFASANDFHEDIYLYRSSVTDDVLWGQGGTESQYWGWIRTKSGSRSYSDPYELIDGGDYRFGAGEYQIITSQSLMNSALLARVIPSLTNSIPSAQWLNLNEYAERWKTIGGLMSGDNAAPFDIVANYGVTYGPDGMGGYFTNSTGGRNPSGSYIANGGQYPSAFAHSFWNAYADTPLVPHITLATIEANGTSWTISFNEAVSIGAGGSIGLSATMSLGSVALTYSSGSGTDSLVFTGNRTVYSGETGTINYSNPGDGLETVDDSEDVSTVVGLNVANDSNQIEPNNANNTARGSKIRGLRGF